MKVTFIKDHVSGLKTGKTLEVSKVHGTRLVKEGFCTTEEELIETSTDEDTKEIEEEFLPVTLTEEDITNKTYGKLQKGKLAGDTISVPNPNYKK